MSKDKWHIFNITSIQAKRYYNIKSHNCYGFIEISKEIKQLFSFFCIVSQFVVKD